MAIDSQEVSRLSHDRLTSAAVSISVIGHLCGHRQRHENAHADRGLRRQDKLAAGRSGVGCSEVMANNGTRRAGGGDGQLRGRIWHNSRTRTSGGETSHAFDGDRLVATTRIIRHRNDCYGRAAVGEMAAKRITLWNETWLLRSN